jgi:hypothetical protein
MEEHPMKVVLVVEMDKSWTAPDIKDNLEESIPGWHVHCLSFVPKGKEQHLLKEIGSLHEGARIEEP